MVFAQCMGQLPTILSVRFPPEVLDFLKTFDLDFMRIVSFGCVIDGANFHSQLLATTLFPILLLVALIPLSAMLAAKSGATSAKNLLAKAALWIAYFSYAPASNAIFMP